MANESTGSSTPASTSSQSNSSQDAIKNVPNTAKPPTKQGGEAGNKSAASSAVGERDGDNSRVNSPESAVDRAIARKEAADSASSKTKETSGRGKVKSLSDIRKLHSDNVAASDRKNNPIEVDNAALPDPKPMELERGRPEPKVKRKSPEQPIAIQEPGIAEPEELEATELSGENEAIQEGSESTSEEDSQQYTPNLKYKSYDEEHDIPELFQSLIKDADSEKTVHEVFQKAHAFEKTKARYEGLDQMVRQEIAPEIQWYRNVRTELNEVAQRGDVFGLLEKFGFDERKVLQAAAERVNLMEAPPEVREMHEARKKAEEQNRQSARRLEALEQKSAESDRLAKRATFESTLARSDVSAVANDFDQKMGKPGSFARMVAQHAHQVYLNSVDMAQSGRGQLLDLTPEQAVQDFMRVYGLKFPEAGANAAPTRQQVPQATAATKPVATPAPKPKIIPNISSRAVSSTGDRPMFKTAQDIANYRKQKFGR